MEIGTKNRWTYDKWQRRIKTRLQWTRRISQLAYLATIRLGYISKQETILALESADRLETSQHTELAFQLSPMSESRPSPRTTSTSSSPHERSGTWWRQSKYSPTSASIGTSASANSPSSLPTRSESSTCWPTTRSQTSPSSSNIWTVKLLSSNDYIEYAISIFWILYYFYYIN